MTKLSLKTCFAFLFFCGLFLFGKGVSAAEFDDPVGAAAASKPLSHGTTPDGDIEEGQENPRWTAIQDALRRVELTDRQEYLLADERTYLTAVRGARFYGYIFETIGAVTGAAVAALLANESDEESLEFWLSVVTTGSSGLSGGMSKYGAHYDEKAKAAREDIENLVQTTIRAVHSEVKRSGEVEGDLTELEAGYIRTQIIKNMERHAYKHTDGWASFGNALIFPCASYRRAAP